MTPWYANPAARSWAAPPSSPAALEFHRTLPGYVPTPLVSLPSLASELGVVQVFVKDESSRLGLPAFKVLGASWACRQVLSRHPGAELVTATDGNHGRAVARMASYFGVSASVFVPSVMLPSTASLIAAEGAAVTRVSGSYDDAVAAASSFAAAAPDRELLQDMAWAGYEEVPAWIVEGYATLLHEIDVVPSLVAVPVGVGSLAEAVVRHYRAPGSARPAVLSVEPDTASCLLASLTARTPTSVPTGATVMAGLNCGTVSSSAWPVLSAGCDAAVAVSDASAVQAAEDLAALGVSSGPSGAATLAGVRAALAEPVRRTALGVDADAVVVLLSTEGGSQPDL